MLDIIIHRTDEQYDVPFHWAKTKGIYPSYVKLNFFGAPEMTVIHKAKDEQHAVFLCLDDQVVNGNDNTL